jgi:hypothetical protein
MKTYSDEYGNDSTHQDMIKIKKHWSRNDQNGRDMIKIKYISQEMTKTAEI